MARSRPVLLLAAVLLALAGAHATPLDAETCTRIMIEHGALETAGVEQNMAKGPQWAKANLAPDKLDQIRRFIELEEQLLFRCTSKSLVKLPAEPDPDPAAAALDTDDDVKEGSPGAESAKPGQPPAAKKKGDPAKKAPAATAKSPSAPVKDDEAAKKKAPAPAKSQAPAKQAKQEGAQAPPAAPAAPAAKGAKPAPKAKADDAYKGPPVDPALNPFANQLAPAAKQ